jgi:phospholipid/cholesterol/gamma-HCH transport system permease protein
MALDTFICMFQRPFAWREYLLQTWFVARVSLVPTLMLSIPFTVLTVFTFNVLLVEFGAADFSGTGASLGTVNQTGPIVTVARRRRCRRHRDVRRPRRPHHP